MVAIRSALYLLWVRRQYQFIITHGIIKNTWSVRRGIKRLKRFEYAIFKQIISKSIVIKYNQLYYRKKSVINYKYYDYYMSWRECSTRWNYTAVSPVWSRSSYKIENRFPRVGKLKKKASVMCVKLKTKRLSYNIKIDVISRKHKKCTDIFRKFFLLKIMRFLTLRSTYLYATCVAIFQSIADGLHKTSKRLYCSQRYYT